MRTFDRNAVIYSSDKVKKIIDGIITQDRYDLVPQPLHPDKITSEQIMNITDCPFHIGMHLNIKEAFCYKDGNIYYKADESPDEQRKKKYLAPFYATEAEIRYALNIKHIEAQRLFDMTKDDFIREGYGKRAYGRDRLQEEFAKVWNKQHTYKRRKMMQTQYNPWTWKVTFELLKVRETGI